MHLQPIQTPYLDLFQSLYSLTIHSMPSKNKIRLDELLCKQGLCESRSKAKDLILSGNVSLNNEPITKPGKMLPPSSSLTLSSNPLYVSRAGHKLQAFLDHFQIDPSNKHILDIGASTGGFTDCLLQRNALSATCIDVGHSQLHPKLLNDPRVTNLEKVNARYLLPTVLPKISYDMIVTDISFISLTKVLPHIWTFLKQNGFLIALVKPQFEATKKEIDRVCGIIKDPEIHQRILNQLLQFCLTHLPHSTLIGYIPSPLKGTDGNQEFLIGLTQSSTPNYNI